MDKIKEIRVKFQKDEFYLYEWISRKSSANSSFIKDILEKAYAKEQVEIYGQCDLIFPPVVPVVKEIFETETTSKDEELDLDFEIDDLN